MRWLNRDVDTGCLCSATRFTDSLASLHSRVQPPNPSSTKSFKVPGHKGRKVPSLAGSRQHLQRANSGDSPAQTQLLARCSPPALAHLGSAPAEGRWCCARLLSAHFFWVHLQLLRRKQTQQLRLGTRLQFTVTRRFVLKHNSITQRQSPPGLLPPRTSSPVGRAHPACCPVPGAAPAAPCPHKLGRWGPLRMLHPKFTALQLHSAAGTAARAALWAQSAGIWMSPDFDAGRAKSKLGEGRRPCGTEGTGTAVGAQQGPQHCPPAGTQPALTPPGRAPRGRALPRSTAVLCRGEESSKEMPRDQAIWVRARWIPASSHKC